MLDDRQAEGHMHREIVLIEKPCKIQTRNTLSRNVRYKDGGWVRLRINEIEVADEIRMNLKEIRRLSE